MANPNRETAVLFAMSHADKAALKAEANRLGITVQALLERRCLGRQDAVPLRPGRVPKDRSDERFLPLTG